MMPKRRGLQVVGILLLSLVCSGFGESAETILIAVTDGQEAVHHYLLPVEGQANANLLDRDALGGAQAAVLAADGKRLYEVSRDAWEQLQAVEVDLGTKSRRQLTRGFQRIDNLRVDNKHRKLYFRVLQKGHDNSQIAAFDLARGDLHVWHAAERDVNVQSFDLNPQSGDLLAWTYSLQEERARVDEAHRLETSVEPPHAKLLLYKEGVEANAVQVGGTDKQPLDIALSADGQHALYAEVQWPQEERRQYTVSHVDLTTGNSHQVLSEQGRFRAIMQPQYAPDGRGFYFTAALADAPLQTDKQGQPIRTRALCRYEFKSKQVTEVWRRDDGQLRQYLLQR